MQINWMLSSSTEIRMPVSFPVIVSMGAKRQSRFDKEKKIDKVLGTYRSSKMKSLRYMVPMLLAVFFSIQRLMFFKKSLNDFSQSIGQWVLGENITLGEDAYAESESTIGDNSIIGKGSIVWSGVTVPEGSTIPPKTFVIPNPTTESLLKIVASFTQSNPYERNHHKLRFRLTLNIFSQMSANVGGVRI